jgi:signal transduction histidine kinase
MQICDNGRGFEHGDGQFDSLGLLGMRARAGSLRGQIKTRPMQRGTAVVVTIPYTENWRMMKDARSIEPPKTAA